MSLILVPSRMNPSTNNASQNNSDSNGIKKGNVGNWTDWKSQLRSSYRSISDLVRDGWISADEAKKLTEAKNPYKIGITPYYAQLMGDLKCPIRLQAIPDPGEKDPILPEWASKASLEIYGKSTPWDADPIGDLTLLKAPRLTHRYGNRAILHLASQCAVYCRFCFRKSHLNDQERTLYSGSLDPALDYLAIHPEIHEVILTGGDPLSISDELLKKVLTRISQVGSIRVVRIHSRMAVTLPYRFTDECLAVLTARWPFTLYLTSHFNHSKELTSDARDTLIRLKRAGVPLLNQSVLLRGVNDSVESLADLFQGLYEVGVLPYYLHYTDWTPGTFHFRTGIEKGRKIFSQLRGLLSGPALPDFILDLPGGQGKISLNGPAEFQMVQSWSDECLDGRVYQFSSPVTQESVRPQSVRYLDLFYKE